MEGVAIRHRKNPPPADSTARPAPGAVRLSVSSGVAIGAVMDDADAVRGVDRELFGLASRADDLTHELSVLNDVVGMLCGDEGDPVGDPVAAHVHAALRRIVADAGRLVDGMYAAARR